MNNARVRLIGAVHAAAARRGLDDEARRDLIERLTGKRSAKDLTVPQLNVVVDHLNGRGGKSTAGEYSFRAKVKALWISASQLGLVRDASDRALDHFVERQTGLSSLRFLTAGEAPRVIEALKSWLARPVAEGGGGVRWMPEAKMDDREAIARAIFERLPDIGDRCDDYCRFILGIEGRRPLTGEEWGRALPMLAGLLNNETGGAA